MSRAALLALPLAILVLGASPLRAQISPGPLSSAHASLEGNRNCVRCHGVKREGIEEHCLECHQGIAYLREAGRGFHARDGRGVCENCHPEHAGREFELIQWPDGSAERFQHDRSGWPLRDAHAKAACKDCHRPDRQTGSAASREPAGSIREGRGWLGLEARCSHCHRDVHDSRLGEQCDGCHAPTDWRTVTDFDHSRTGYALDGRHRELRCAQCHQNEKLGAKTAADGTLQALYHPLPHADCAACHADPHKGRFSGKCSACHVTGGFQLASGSGFNHALTRFPLRGAHAKAKCDACHDEQRAWGKQPPFDRCDRCHSDPHGGQLVAADAPAPDCAECHSAVDWKESTYDLRRHAQTDFALEGAHARVACGACHRAPEETTPDPSWGSAAVRFRMESSRCLDCHLPAHGAELAAERDCGECHGTEGWRPSSFDRARHVSAGWPLERAHAALECGRCHKPASGTTGGVDGGSAGWVFGSTGKKCTSCHVDPHGQRYEDAARWTDEHPCLRCHDMEAFVPSTLDPAAHAALGYPLDGAHRAVPCFACHPGLAQPPSNSSLRAASAEPRRLRFNRERRDCRDCHDPATLQTSGARP